MSEIPPSRLPEPLLRSTIPGEYLALLGMTYAAFATVIWTLSIPRNPVAIAFVLIQLWIFARATGFLSGRFLSPIVTAGLLIVAFWPLLFPLVEGNPPPASVLFSPLVSVGMLFLLLIIDLADYRRSRRRDPLRHHSDPA